MNLAVEDMRWIRSQVVRHLAEPFGDRLSVRLWIGRKSRLAREIESSLYQALMDSRFSFMQRGIRTIEEVYNSVRTLYLNLCDDSYYCSENCRQGNNQPEWNHTVRSALNILRSTNAPVRHSGRRGYWEFL